MNGGFYQQLGVETGASTGQVRAAYGRAVAQLVKRRKSLVDSGGDPAVLDQQRAMLDEAWAVLSDPVRRRRYDAMRAWQAEGAHTTNPESFWEQVAPSLVHPAAAAAVKLLRATTHLKELAPVKQSPSASEAEPPTLVPHDEDRTMPRAARLTAVTEADEPQAQRPQAAPPAPPPIQRPSPTPGPANPGAPVVPLPTPQPALGPDLRVVDGSPDANAVIVLPTDAPRHKTLSTEDVARLVDTHGYSGGLLRSVREARGIPLQEMADTTRISARYLQAIEADDHGSLPSATFVKGYVREMARLLKLDDGAVVEGYMRRLSQQS